MTALLESPLALRHQPAWKVRGLCNGLTGADSDWWLPDDELPAAEQARQRQLAVAVCRSGCPVVAQCLAEALATGEAWSVRGGTLPAERRRMAARRGFPRPSPEGASQHGTNSKYVGGCRCRPCTDARARYVANWRARCSVTSRAMVVLAVLARPAGRGRHKAWPGQVFIEIGRSA